MTYLETLAFEFRDAGENENPFHAATMSCPKDYFEEATQPVGCCLDGEVNYFICYKCWNRQL